MQARCPLGVPGYEELAMGAIASGGVCALKERSASGLGAILNYKVVLHRCTSKTVIRPSFSSIGILAFAASALSWKYVKSANRAAVRALVQEADRVKAEEALELLREQGRMMPPQTAL